MNGSLKIHLLCSVFLLSCGIIIVIIILKANSEKHRCDIFSLAVERSFKGNKYPPTKEIILKIIIIVISYALSIMLFKTI